jgi:hypothetical protein
MGYSKSMRHDRAAFPAKTHLPADQELLHVIHSSLNILRKREEKAATNLITSISKTCIATHKARQGLPPLLITN